MGIMAYVTTGYLSKDKVARAVSAGRSEANWIDVFDDAFCTVETIAALMSKFFGSPVKCHGASRDDFFAN